MEAHKDASTQPEPEQVPLGQVVFDEIWLFALLSLVISLVIYNLWGMMELLRAPVLP